MLTVIIAPEEFVDCYEKYGMFTENIFREYDIALCKCYYNADNLLDMVPDLYDCIADSEQWRAVILQPDRREFFNPFDCTGYVDAFSKTVNRDFFNKRRADRFKNYEKAAKNPLVMLSSALCGSVYSKLLMSSDDYEAVLNGSETEYSLLLSRRLKDMNTKVEAFRLRSNKDDSLPPPEVKRLKHLAIESMYGRFVKAIEARNTDFLRQMLDSMQFLKLNRIIGGELADDTALETIDNEELKAKVGLLKQTSKDGDTKPPAEVKRLRCLVGDSMYDKVVDAIEAGDLSNLKLMLDSMQFLELNRIIGGELADDTALETIGSEELKAKVGLLKQTSKDGYTEPPAEVKRLRCLVGDSMYDKVVDAIEERDLSFLRWMLNDEQILEFNRILGGEDASYTAPDTIDADVCNYRKYLVMSEVEGRFTLLDKPPAEVRCVALRCSDTETYLNRIKHKPSAQSKYSAFAENNLYHPSMTFFTYDIMSVDDKRYDVELVKFLAALAVFSANDIPRGLVSGGYLYRLECSFSKDGLMRICQDYLNKLYATHAEIGFKINEVSQQRQQEMDDFTAEQTFENPVVIPVSIRKSRSKDGLFAKVDNLGLAKDCPQKEDVMWNGQFRDIRKNFIKYLREPRRAVKTAVKGPFKEENAVVDDRIRCLTEYQLEDVVYKLEEEERKMVETSTSQLFDTEAYNKSIEEANKKIDDRIAKRMTKRKSIVIGAVATVLYFIGFIPLLISQSNNPLTVSTAVVIMSVCVGLFLVTGMLTLLFFRYKLKKLFKFFNEVMHNICHEIDESLAEFSKYISHACNVMREFSVINYDKNPQNDLIAILTKHKLDLENRIRQIVTKYSLYIDVDSIDYTVEPYKYDFTKMKDYDYPPDKGSEVSRKADFIIEHNHIYLPVDYLYSVIAIKEDLYD